MIKTFSLTQDAEVNAFIETVVEPQLTVTDNVIAVTYTSTKDGYEDYFVNFLIDSSKRNLYNEEIRKVSLDAEVALMTELGTNLPEYDELKGKQKDADKNIKRFEAKIAALKAWQTSKS